MLKAQLRQRLRERRRRLLASYQAQCAQRITHHLLHSPYFQKAKHIALYAPFDGEVPTTPILERALLLHKYCYLPALKGNQLQFMQIDQHTPLIHNRYGINEPNSTVSTKVIPPQALDLVLVPLVAFDRKGYRLGMGGGYYDRTFRKKGAKRPLLLGLGYDFQKVGFVPHTNLDVVLDAVITEKQFYLPSS